MINFKEKLLQVITERVGAIRPDVNMASDTAKNVIVLDIFASISKACDEFNLTTDQVMSGEILHLED